MIAANYNEFSNDLKTFFDLVELNNETLIVNQTSGKGAVLISLEEYNSIMETMHLFSSNKNAQKLVESINQLKNVDFATRELIEN